MNDLGWIPKHLMYCAYFYAQHLDYLFEEGPDGHCFPVKNWDSISPDLPDYMSNIDARDFLSMGFQEFHDKRYEYKAPPSVAEPRDRMMACLKVISEGKKVISLSIDQCLALEDVDINVSLKDLQMPFPAVVIDIPNEYRSLRGLKDRFIVVHMSEEYRRLVICSFSGNLTDKWGNQSQSHPSDWMMAWPLKEEEDLSIEHLFNREVSGYKPREGATDLSSMRHVVFKTLRVALNTCLMMVYQGVVESDNKPTLQYNMALRKIMEANKKKKKKESKSLSKARGIVGGHFDKVYHFSKQMVSLFNKTEGEINHETGMSKGVKPHWRKAHFRMVACGKGRQDRRLTFIGRSFVNKHRFAGSMTDTTVLYKD